MSDTVAERYARAIFDLGVESGQLESLSNQIRNFADTYAQNRELQGVLDNPLIELSKREAILQDIAGRVGLAGVGLNAVRFIAQRNRLGSLPDIARRLASLADEKAGIVRATVTSAGPMPESFYERLVRELEGATGRKVALDRKQDPSLIAGVVTRIGDNTIDGSIKGRLAEIERQLSAI
ncbi:MAG TPA: ATP synthase F1 subunit delta [Polyangiaceae bacterium]|jgi:F-type H+-transporting ATPase subunit delta|nr:ATP synthase F1 subunit delta [Polyangiaceae bacterium]